jgi:LmbE family N-acetylglucosaminyl deacetylase
MTTLDTLGTTHPNHDEVSDAALAMADFDAKGGDHKMALEWLGVAEQHRALDLEYSVKRASWAAALRPTSA